MHGLGCGLIQGLTWMRSCFLARRDTKQQTGVPLWLHLLDGPEHTRFVFTVVYHLRYTLYDQPGTRILCAKINVVTVFAFDKVSLLSLC